MILDQFSLKGKVAVITGGGQGLGLAFCRAFAEAGADVVVAEINGETGPKAVEEVESIGRKAVYVETDVTNKTSVESMVEKAISELGAVDILMNNAGIVHWGASEHESEEDWRRVVNVNLNGVFLCAQAVGKHMIERQKGSIVNIASMSAHIVNRPQCQASYNATKAAVIQLTKSLATEWAQHNIRVNSMSPGYMGTDMAKPFFDDPTYGGDWIPNIPMKRPGEPEELGGLAVFLASDASSYMTGSDVVIDGGFSLW